MAELEVVKHTKKAYTVWKKPGATLKHKIMETLVEIAIIVFAITLSLWLHNWSEHRHQVQEEKEFLTGLKTDLERDLDEMQSDKAGYIAVANGFGYFYDVTYGAPLRPDSSAKYGLTFYKDIRLNVNSSRFEGLKASGKIDIIENKELLNAMLELYQEDIPWLEYLTDNFNSFKKNRLEPFLDQHLYFDEQGHGNWKQVLRLPEARNLLRRGGGINEIINQYQKAIDKNKKITSLIAKEA